MSAWGSMGAGSARPGRQGGFTLIEALASLAILALVSAMLLSGVAGGHRVWDRLDAQGARADAVETAQALLRDRLEHAYPATRYDASAPYVDFAGFQDRAVFLGPTAMNGGVERQTLALTTGGDLVLTGRAGPTVVLNGVRALELAYYGPGPVDPAPRWQDHWESRARPPQMVRVRVGFSPPDRRTWPDLIARPVATVDSACVLDPSTSHCRGLP